MNKNSLVLLVGGLLAVAAGYAAVLLDAGPPLFPATALALGASAVLGALLRLGARRGGSIPDTLRLASTIAFIATAIGLLFALAAPPPADDGPLLLGLPRVTAVMLLCTGLVPLVLLPVAYARAFDIEVLNETDLARVAELARRAEDEERERL